MKVYFASALVCTIASTASAQTAPVAAEPAPPLAIQAVERTVAANQVMLPSNTEITLSMNEELTTKGGRIETGHRFGLTLTHDVTIGNYVVIPRGTPAFGEVTWKTGKGAFGKSGKMEIELRYVDLNGRRILAIVGQRRLRLGGYELHPPDRHSGQDTTRTGHFSFRANRSIWGGQIGRKVRSACRHLCVI